MSAEPITRILLLAEAAALLRVSQSSVRRLIRESHLPRLAGRPVRVLERDLHAYIEAQLIAPGSPLPARATVTTTPAQARTELAGPTPMERERAARAWAAKRRTKRIARRQ